MCHLQPLPLPCQVWHLIFKIKSVTMRGILINPAKQKFIYSGLAENLLPNNIFYYWYESINCYLAWFLQINDKSGSLLHP